VVSGGVSIHEIKYLLLSLNVVEPQMVELYFAKMRGGGIEFRLSLTTDATTEEVWF